MLGNDSLPCTPYNGEPAAALDTCGGTLLANSPSYFTLERANDGACRAAGRTTGMVADHKDCWRPANIGTYVIASADISTPMQLDTTTQLWHLSWAAT
mmetsp:Transcript_109027/g.188806  ORF Transcript_109027/g.188806 Transcript_109027/m.188806 type:complete len:98 (-) Transcript_109027:74-367(-)